METPKTLAGTLTERIMFSCKPLLSLETSQYNLVYTSILGILESEVQRLTAELDKAQRERDEAEQCRKDWMEDCRKAESERDAALLEAKGLREELEALKQK